MAGGTAVIFTAQVTPTCRGARAPALRPGCDEGRRGERQRSRAAPRHPAAWSHGRPRASFPHGRHVPSFWGSGDRVTLVLWPPLPRGARGQVSPRAAKGIRGGPGTGSPKAYSVLLNPMCSNSLYFVNDFKTHVSSLFQPCSAVRTLAATLISALGRRAAPAHVHFPAQRGLPFHTDKSASTGSGCEGRGATPGPGSGEGTAGGGGCGGRGGGAASCLPIPESEFQSVNSLRRSGGREGFDFSEPGKKASEQITS